uniref:Nucleotidyl transferase domain-containing protein n=1 Tax=Tetranychus urticae TaxID=32264 RepID=T1JYQ6_TETUR
MFPQNCSDYITCYAIRLLMKHVALILARSGSQSIPDKNIFPINGTPLIGYCLKCLVLYI